jgi:hypothetical protein
MDSEQKTESVSLSEAESALFAEYRQASNDIERMALGALCLIIRQRGLAGNWRVEGNTLVRQDG